MHRVSFLAAKPGSPKLVGFGRPVWRRSRHSTLMPGVTPGTAPRGDGQAYKSPVTVAKASLPGGRAAASSRHREPQAGAADARR